MTNFEKIKQMSVEKLVTLLLEFDPCVANVEFCGDASQCKKCVKQWLESEVDNNA